MFRSFRHRNFRLFFVGQFVSLTGSWMQQVAQAWLVYRLTRDPFQLGLVGFIGQSPAYLLGLYAGVLVDRSDRRRLVMATQGLSLLQAACLAILTLSGRVELWQVYALAALQGAINCFDLPARQVMIGELVPPEERPNAIALNSTIVNGSRMVGPALAGALVGLWGEGVCFAINAVSFLAVLASLSAMEGARGAPRSKGGESAVAEIRTGLDYALGHEPIRILLLLLAVTSVAGMPFVVLMPIFADQVLGSGSMGLGLLMAASGVGATLGSLALARRPVADGLDQLVVRTMLGFGVTLVAFSFSTSMAWSCALMGLLGLGVMMQFAGVNTLLQELADDRYRGRVMALYTMVFMGLSPIGSFAAGALARRIGAPWTVALGAAVCIVVALQYVEQLPRLVRLAGLRARSGGLGLAPVSAAEPGS
ncbi:MAG: MFS transporter [Elusimicrobia bacterium]|nr:MFS transporter [Elusimicrobiota bacterium]